MLPSVTERLGIEGLYPLKKDYNQNSYPDRVDWQAPTLQKLDIMLRAPLQKGDGPAIRGDAQLRAQKNAP